MNRKNYISYRISGNYDNLFLYAVYNTFSGKEYNNIDLFTQAFSWKLQQEALEKGEFPAIYIKTIINKIIKELDNIFAITFLKDKENNVINIY